MERPWKRVRISDPDIRSPRDPGSQMAEGLFTSEMGIRSDDSDRNHPTPSRTIALADFQRRGLSRPPLQRRNAAYQFVPRAPAATVTANVIEINVGDGTATSVAATITAITSDTIVSLDGLGSLTLAASSAVTGAVGPALTDSSQSIITFPAPTPPPSPDSTSSGSSVSSTGFPSIESQGNSTISGSSTSDSTVTVTATSTIDFAYLNGTFITTSFSGEPTGILTSTRRSGSSTSTDGPSGIGVSSGSSDLSSSTLYGAGGPHATGSTTTSSGSAASSSSSSSDGGGGPGLSPTQQTVVGGVVGGIAGLAIVLLVLLGFLRWYRRRLKARGELPEQIEQRNVGLRGPSHHHTMSERSSGIPLTSAVAASLRKFRPLSQHTTGTTATASTMPSTIPETEKGFQRLAGRKIAPVLGTGGDPYGGSYGAFEKESGAPGPSNLTRERSLAGASFYRDSNGFYGGRGDMPSTPIRGATVTDPQPRSQSAGPSRARDFAEEDLLHPQPNPSQISLPASRPEGMAALRPSPARTPVTVSPAASSIRLPIQQQPAMEDAPPLPPTPVVAGAGLTVPISRDGIGRSLASQDGSRVSRSSGRSRFAEQI